MSEQFPYDPEEEKNKNIIYTEPISIEQYDIESDTDFYRGWERYPLVAQGYGKLSIGGKLYSDGFSQCSAFIIKDPETKRAGLFHIANLDFESPQEKLLEEFFLEWLNTLNINEKEKQDLSIAVSDVCKYNYPRTMKRENIAPRLRELGIDRIRTKLFAGDTGRYNIDRRLRESLLSYLGVNLDSTIIFQDYHRHWSIIADMDIDIAKIHIPYKKQILQYNF